MSKFHLQIITPVGYMFDGDVSQISVRSTEGEMAVLAGHIPAVTALTGGECRIYTDEGIKKADYAGGMLAVTKELTRVFFTDFLWK